MLGKSDISSDRGAGTNVLGTDGTDGPGPFGLVRVVLKPDFGPTFATYD